MTHPIAALPSVSVATSPLPGTGSGHTTRIDVDLVAAEEADETVESGAPEAPTAHVPSFEEAFESLHARAYQVAYRLIGRRAEAEDVAQEALARALVRWKQVADHGEAWVVRVASNLAIGWWRKFGRLTTLGHEAEAGDTTGASFTAERVDLVRALRSLSRRQREVVTLRYVSDVSEADTARLLHCAPGTVKRHASRGLAALRSTLGEEVR